MSDIIETYQAEEEIKQPEESRFAFGRVADIAADGLTIIFDGEGGTASTKKFLRNSAINFEVGQRVLLEKIDGQYIVCFPVSLNGGFEYVKLSDLADYLKGSDVVDSLTSSARDLPLSANQGRELKALIPNMTASTTTRNTGTIAGGGSVSSSFSISQLRFLTGVMSNYTTVVVNAYVNGNTIHWRAFNLGNAAVNATLTFSYVTE